MHEVDRECQMSQAISINKHILPFCCEKASAQGQWHSWVLLDYANNIDASVEEMNYNDEEELRVCLFIVTCKKLYIVSSYNMHVI